MSATTRRRLGWWVVLVLIVVLGGLARLWNLDFDRGQHLHPDERHWALTAAELDRQPAPDGYGTVFGPVLDWLDGQRSPANPYRATESFVYGPVMLATARGVAGWLHDGVVDGSQPASMVASTLDGLGVPLIRDDGTASFDAGYDVEIVGRLLAALIDTATIVVVALIGRRLFGWWAGLIAAFFFASCVLAIQHAHFLGSEPLLGLCCALLLLATLRIERDGQLRSALIGGGTIGLACGAALAAKLNAIGLVLVPLAACTTLAVLHRRRADLLRIGALLLGAFVAFRFLHPAAFRGLTPWPSADFLDDLAVLRDQRSADIPPSIQWADRTPILQPLVWLVRFTVGPGISIAAALGGIALVRRMRSWPASGVGRWADAVVLASVVGPFLYVSLTNFPTGRYYVPMLPALCVIAGAGVVATWRWSIALERPGRLAARAAVGGSLVLAALWGLAFVNGVYGEPHTRIRATEWIVDNVEAGSVLSSQAWDDGLPLRLPGVDVDAYRFEQLVMVGTDSEEKVERVAHQLGEIDYVVESSPRLWGVVGRIPERFPSTINFFDALDDGRLGFRRVATFTSPPELAWFSIDDSSAEEGFSVYDHPEVRIWEKVDDVSYADIVTTLDPVAAANALTITAADAHAGGLLLTAEERARLSDGPTYDDAFDLGRSGWVHALWWFVLLEVLGSAAFVMCFPIFRHLPDAGFGIAKTVGLALPTLVLFTAAGWLTIGLSRWLVIAVISGLLAAATSLAWRRRRELHAWWVEHRRLVIAIELLTVAVFWALVALRAANPDLWHPTRGGEKPFELTVLTDVLRTDTLPPYDAWFAGGVTNYYYVGYLMLLTPARLFATAPGVALNLGLAVFGASAAGAAGSAGALLVGEKGTSTGGRTRVVGAVVAAFAVLALANLASIGELWRRLVDGGAFDWWGVSRVIPDSVAITEFPAWSLLFADLHPHVMGICLVLTIGVAVVALHHHLVADRARPAIVTALLTGLLVGMARATNTWDLPLTAGAVLLALALAALGGARRRTVTAAGVAAAVAAIGFWLPYTRRGLVFDDGVTRNVMSTPWWSWFQQFGLYAVATLVVVAPTAARAVRASSVARGRVRIGHLVVGGGALVTVGLVVIWPGAATGSSALLLAGLAAWGASRPARAEAGPRLALFVTALGWSIQVGVELLVVRNDAGRQNTVFKFWYQSWVLLAVGTVGAVVAVLAHRSSRRSGVGERISVVAAWGLAGVAVLIAGTFWIAATPERLDDRLSAGGWSLDGEAYLASGVETAMYDTTFTPGDDAPLIDWLRSHVEGIATIAEAPGEDYQWSGRIAWSTGLASPIGWQYHETQQRRAYGDAIARRVADLRALYTTTDPDVIAKVLADRRLDYVVFGTVERALSSPDSARVLGDFECLDIVVRSDDLWVAKVDRACVTERRPSG